MIEKRSPLDFEELKRVFKTAPFVELVGIELVSFSEGYCETVLDVRPDHLQQTGLVHAGVLATMADHTAGGTATTIVRPDQFILTAEFKINFLRGAKGKRLRCKGRILKPGSNLIVVECEVFSENGDAVTLVSKVTATMSVLNKAHQSVKPVS